LAFGEVYCNALYKGKKLIKKGEGYIFFYCFIAFVLALVSSILCSKDLLVPTSV